MGTYLVLFPGNLNRISPSPQAFQGSVNSSLGGNAKVLEKVLGRRAGAESMHAHEFTIPADHSVPAPAYGGLDGNLHRRVTDDGLLPLGGLRQQQFQRGD